MRPKQILVSGAALLALVVTLACGAGGTSDGGSGTGTDPKADPKKEEVAAQPAKIGQAVRDGKFEFIVQKMECGVAKVGPKSFGDTAQGQFCLITLNVKNIGKEPQTFSDSSQKAFGTGDVEYSTDSSAALYANGEQNLLFNEINPGNEVTGVIVFDIPKEAKLIRLKLHDSPFSGGVSVTLS